MATTGAAEPASPYQVYFAGEAAKELEKIGPSRRERILKAIAKKLRWAPLDYGEPLVQDLAGYRRLRVGGCRVVYKVAEMQVTVFVLAVGKRKDDSADDIYAWLTPDELSTRLAAIRTELEQLQVL